MNKYGGGGVILGVALVALGIIIGEFMNVGFFGLILIVVGFSVSVFTYFRNESEKTGRGTEKILIKKKDIGIIGKVFLVIFFVTIVLVVLGLYNLFTTLPLTIGDFGG